MVDVRDHPRPRFRHIAPRGACFLLLTLAGCGGVAVPDFSSGPRLSAGDFRNPEAAQSREANPLPTYVPERRRAERVDIRSLTEDEANAGVGQVEIEVGDPVLTDTPPAATGARNSPSGAGLTSPVGINADNLTIVEAKIGDLNGLPVLAREWLEPLGPRLRAEAVGKTRAEWEMVAFTVIKDRIDASLQEELFLAEARAGLSDQERAGLRVFLERFEQDVVRGSYGSQTLADEQLRRTAGIGLEEAKRERERATLVWQIQQRIRDRVQVTSRDLLLEYERNDREFNPPPSAVFHQIRVRSSDTESIEAINTRLASESFVEVAQDDRNQTPDAFTREISGDLASSDLYGPAPLQKAASALSPGEWVGPIEAGPATYWIYLDRIEDNSQTFYDAQLELRQRLMEERGIEEKRRYLLRLFERAGISNYNDLILGLVNVAEEWYYTGETAP